MPKTPGGKPTNQKSPTEIRQGAGAGSYPRPMKAPRPPKRGMHPGSPMGHGGKTGGY